MNTDQHTSLTLTGPLPDLDRLSNEQLRQRADELIRNEDFPGAYSVLIRLIESESATPNELVITGLVALKLEHFEEAMRHFACALQNDPDNYDAAYNLALLEKASGDGARALGRLRRLVRNYPQKAELQNDLAILWQEQKRPGRAEALFRKALRLNPDFSLARNNAMQFFLEHHLIERGRRFLATNEQSRTLSACSRAEIHRWKEILETAASSSRSVTEIVPDTSEHIGNVAVFATHRTFIEPITAALAKRGTIRYFNGGSDAEMRELMRWADVAWFEWCDDLIIRAASMPKTCPILCRLHSYEAFTDMPQRVNWDRVDHLLFVNDSVRTLVRNTIPSTVPTSVIANGVDLDRFCLDPGKRYGKKIASVGYINYKKNPSLLLYCFKKIYEYDQEYSLHLAGTHQDPRIALYFEHFLRRNPLPITFDGWVEDMPAWYADKDFVISTSLFESFHYSIAEGMACGVMPLIHDWYGASGLYPAEYLFSDPDSCLSLLQTVEQSDRSARAVANRQHIANRYDLKTQVAAVCRLLHRLVSP